ncbi:ABC transporter ATP-binding protein [Pelistega suis]|uniref:ABC transporter ATP-binding protein n=1 Tax=Pelistega suis TaxID=1631957 RepID=A0A849P7R9_9BURK|nr:ABC transporter ATP-binding protein [Pelistega suis]MCQ9329245.1 ABC transporter ATP-binding protein [Pelistega suis]NOL52344.1 ABC transporter ATP-binding protein [Pelistega suis]
MLKIDNVSLKYGAFTALNRVSLRADQGELIVLLGANGAGKSTLFLAISGVHPIAEGKILYQGEDIAKWKSPRIVKEGLVHCPEGRKLFPGMSVYKNLQLGGYVHKKDKKGVEEQIEEVFELFPILKEKQHQMAGSLSGGQQQMVAIGRALVSRPKVLLLDEPSLGLAPLVVKQMFEVIQRINAQGTTVLLAEQNAYSALKICHRAYVMERGNVILEGDKESLLHNEDIKKAYLGA